MVCRIELKLYLRTIAEATRVLDEERAEKQLRKPRPAPARFENGSFCETYLLNFLR